VLLQVVVGRRPRCTTSRARLRLPPGAPARPPSVVSATLFSPCFPQQQRLLRWQSPPQTSPVIVPRLHALVAPTPTSPRLHKGRGVELACSTSRPAHSRFSSSRFLFLGSLVLSCSLPPAALAGAGPQNSFCYGRYAKHAASRTACSVRGVVALRTV
jgi:hypothetical protein